MDTWTIPPEMRAKYDARFEIIQQGGAVTGDVARALFLKSGLPPQVLAKIWYRTIYIVFTSVVL